MPLIDVTERFWPNDFPSTTAPVGSSEERTAKIQKMVRPQAWLEAAIVERSVP